MKTFALALAAATLFSACASTPEPPIQAPSTVPAAQPAAVDPVGTFDFSTTVEGMGAVAGTITIQKATTGTGYTGSISTNVTEPLSIRTVTVDGQRITVSGDTPDGPLTFTMDFKGDDFSGNWSLSGMTGTHTGKRRKST